MGNRIGYLVKNKNNQRPAGLQFQVRHSRLAVKADVFQDKKNPDRKEDVATYERLEDIPSVRVDDPMSQTSSSDPAKLLEAPEKSIGDALVDEGAEASEPSLSLVKMRTSTPSTGGLLHAGSPYKTQETSSPHNFFVGASEKRSTRKIV